MKIVKFYILLVFTMFFLSCNSDSAELPTTPFVDNTSKIEIANPSGDAASCAITDFSNKFKWEEPSDTDIVLILGIFSGDPQSGTTESSIDLTTCIAYGISGPGVSNANLEEGAVSLQDLYDYDGNFTSSSFDIGDFTNGGTYFWGIWGFKGGKITHSSPIFTVTLNY